MNASASEKTGTCMETRSVESKEEAGGKIALEQGLEQGREEARLCIAMATALALRKSNSTPI